jgi:hypothetical protein
MDGRIEPLPRRGPDLRRWADNVLVFTARVICVVAGFAALGVGLVGMLAGTGLGPWGTGVGSVLLLIGLPWRWLSVAFVGVMAAALVLIGLAA